MGIATEQLREIQVGTVQVSAFANMVWARASALQGILQGGRA